MKPYFQLCKPVLSFFSALSAATGFILAVSGFNTKFAVAVTGVFLLACGSCAFNQYQERTTDALMERTRKRPLPSGRIKPFNALIFSLLLIVAGLSLLSLTKSYSAMLLGACAVLLYNCVYTYLKRKTAFASIPCALIGALPPAIGWFAGGGGFRDNRIIALCFLFYIWQVTHFWLLFLSHGDDYRQAGFPSLTDLFSNKQLERIVFVWLCATAVASLFITFFGIAVSPTVRILLFGVVSWLVYNGVKLITVKKSRSNYLSAFGRVNVYMLFIMLLFSVDKWL